MEATRTRPTQTNTRPAPAAVQSAAPPKAAASSTAKTPLYAGVPAIRLGTPAAGTSQADVSEQVGQLVSAPGTGEPLRPEIQKTLEDSLEVDLSPVRVHTDERSAGVADRLNARAFTYGPHIFLGSRERPADLGLMAHEVAHVIQQQGAPVLQMSSSTTAPDTFEQEARQVSSTVQQGEQVSVTGRTAGPQVQKEDVPWYKRAGRAIGRGVSAVGTAVVKGAEAVVEWGEDIGWSLLNKYAPDLVPIIRQGIGEWLKEKISAAIETVFNTLMAPVRAVTGVVQSLSAHFSELLSWMREAATQIAHGDCSVITKAVEKVQKVIEGFASSIIDRVKHLAQKVGDFFKGIWERFGAPVWDFLKKVGGWVWDKIQQLGNWIWEKTEPIRKAVSRAWKWIKDKLGIGEGPEGQNGLLQWVQKKAAAAWDWIQAKIEPIKKPLMIVAGVIGGVILLFSPAGPIVAIGAAAAGLFKAISWIREHLNTPDGVVKNRGVLQGVIIPAIMNAVKAVTGKLAGVATSVAEKLNKVAGGLGDLVGAVGGSILRFAVSAVRWIADQFQALVQWGSEKLQGLVKWVSNGLERLHVFFQPVLDVLAKVGEVIVDILKLPGLIIGKAWKMIPACIRDPFVDFLINQILKRLPFFEQLTAIADIWSKIKAGAMTALKQVFKEGKLKEAVITIFKTLLDILNVPLDLVKAIFSKAGTALELITANPKGFLLNVLLGIKEGFVLFFKNILKHLLGGVIGWLMSEIKDAGINITGDLTDGWAIFKLILQVLGLTIENILARLEKKLANPALVAKLKQMFKVLSGVWEWIKVLIKEGPAGLWGKIKEQLSNLKEMLISGIVSWISQNIIVKVTVKILGMLNPAGLLMAIVNGIIAVYKAVQSFVKYLTQMLQILNTVLDSLVALAKGDISPAAVSIEASMARAIPVMIGFLANQLGLSGIGKRIGELIEAARKQVEKAIDWLIDKALSAGRAILDKLGGGSKVTAEEVWFSVQGERHHLFIRRMGTDSVIMIASDEKTAFDQLKNFEGRISTDIPVASDKENAQKRIRDAEAKLTEWSSRADKPDTNSVEYLKQLAEIMQPLYIIFGHPDVPETKVQFEPEISPNGIKGKYVLAQPLTKKAGDVKGSASTSSDIPASGRMVSMNKNSLNWVKLHLLHFNLHGPDDPRNFAPGTQKNNQQMYGIEEKVLNTLNTGNGLKVLWYEVNVMYRTDEDSDFPETISIQHGEFDQKTNTRTSTNKGPTISVPPPGEGINFASLSYDGRVRLEKIGKLPPTLARALAQAQKGRGKPFNSPEDVVEAIIEHQRTIAPGGEITDIIVARINDGSLVIK